MTTKKIEKRNYSLSATCVAGLVALTLFYFILGPLNFLVWLIRLVMICVLAWAIIIQLVGRILEHISGGEVTNRWGKYILVAVVALAICPFVIYFSPSIARAIFIAGLP